MGWRLLVLGCSACGRIGFASQADAAPDAPFPTGPFGPAAPIAELNSAVEDDDVSLTADMLEVYFGSQRGATPAVWRSTRQSVGDTWSPPVEVTELGNANNPRVSLDGLTLYCASGGGVGMSDVWFTKRADRSAAWPALQPVPGVNTAGEDYEPWLSTNELVIYMSVLPTMGPGVVVRGERISTSEPFGPLVVVDPISNPASYEGGTWVREDERLLIYHSDVTGGRDLYMTTRAATAEPWGAPAGISELNMATADSDAWLSPDGHTIYFVSRRTGNDDIYMATR